MSRHGALHAVLGEAHEQNQTPHRAVLLSAIAAFVPAGIMAIRGIDMFDIYGLVGTLATFGFVTAYILIAIAAPLYLQSLGRLTVHAICISVLAVVAMGFALLGSLYPVPAAPYSFLPYIYLALLLAGFTWSTVWSARPTSLASE
jgi:amino acid transporter